MTLKQKAKINELKDKIEKIKERNRHRKQKKKEEKKEFREIEMIKFWIQANINEISMADFFMEFSKLYNLELKKIEYRVKNLGKLKESSNYAKESGR